MPTLPVPIRGNNAYFGFAKQSVGGTAVAPNVFPRWMDGSSIEISYKEEKIREGDGTRRLSQAIKNMQMAKIKLVFLPRPVELGFFEAAAMGIGSDTVTAAIISGRTILTSAAAGATTVILDANTGLTGSGTATLAVGIGTTNEEVVTVTTPAGSGTTFTLTASAVTKFLHQGAVNTTSATTISVGVNTIVVALATNIIVGSRLLFSAGVGTAETVTVTAVSGTNVTATFVNTHSGAYTITASADTVASSTSHAIIDASDGNYYTVEVGIGALSGGLGPVLRVRDCKLDQIKRIGKAGKILEYQVEFSGITTSQTGSPATVTLENHKPFFYETGVWNLDGSLTGDALLVEAFDIDQKNNLDTGIQSEALTLDALIYGMLDVTCTFSAIFTVPGRLYSAYFGSTTGTTDAFTIGQGSLVLTFTQVDAFHILTYTMNTLQYTKVGVPVPKIDGKHLLLPMTAEATTNQGLNAFVLQTTITNTQTASY